jgi:hypothetical protein
VTSKELLVASMTSAAHAAPTVGSVLAIVHEGWIRQVTDFLAPASDLRSDFWSRWGAVRFLGDQFDGRFRLECAFAAALEGLVSPEAAAHLAGARDDVERTREELITAGRRQDAAELTAVLARRFLKEVARWCVELELATEHLVPAGLPVSGRRLLARLRIADALGR